MKKITIVVIFCISILKGYSQCKDCHEGKNDNYKNNPKAAKALPPDSSGGLAKSYILENVCGLNWQQSSVLTETRSQTYGFNTNGTGLPCTVPITFDSCKNVDSVVTAFLYFNGSYQTQYAANPASVIITNPVSQVFTYSADSIGTGPSKCWGETGTIAYRVNITSCIKGGGNYVVNMIGTGLTSWAIDGTTIVIIYVDKSATYSGSIVLYDGLWTGQGVTSQTFSGFNVCKATPTGQGFSILADMQGNVTPNTNTQVYNGSTGSFPNTFYNFCTVTTPLTAGQTSTTYSVYTNNGGDCYSWVLAGLYWQNTNCMTCTPSVSATLSITATPRMDTICLGDSIQLAASGGTTYVWTPATGLSCTNCPNPKASPNATTTYSVTGFTGCSFGEDTLRVVVSPQPGPTVTPLNPEYCILGSVQLNVTGGGNYFWKPSATLTCDSCPNPIASPTLTTVYTLFSSYKGCRDSLKVKVTVDTVPVVTVSPKGPGICVGDNVKLTASGAGSYTWQPAFSLSCSFCNDPVASPTVTTVYTVVGGSGACSDTTTDTVYVLPAPVAVVTPKFDSVCQGDTVILTGSGGKTYLWSNGQTTSTIKVAPSVTTIYTLSVSSGACPDTATVKVKITPTVIPVTSIIDSVICPYDSSYLSVRGIGGPATFRWSNGATTTSITVNPGVTTIYTVTAYGICDSAKAIAKVTVAPLPKPVISGLNWRCLNGKDTLKVSGGNTYKWSNGSKDSVYYTGAIKNDSIITVTAYNSLGCSTTISDTVFLRQPPKATANPPAIFCAGQPITLTASATGSNPPFVYTWSTGQTGTSITINPGPDSATTYTVHVSNGCTGTAVTTAIPNTPSISACCSQILTNLNDTAVLSVSGNSIRYKWQESPDKGTITCLDSNCDKVRVIAPVTTSYTVIGTDSNGCQGEQILVVEVDVPCFSVIIPNVFTPNDPVPFGLNNIFYIKTQNMDAWSLTIFDRWGKEIYKSTNPNQYWDGNTEGGSKALDGVYYYVIDATCQNATYKKDGFVQLIR